MKKNGFTLVEILAVIAILAILVIIALPNVLKSLEDSRRKSFMSEVRLIAKTANQEWLASNINLGYENAVGREYARCQTEQCDNNLELTGRKSIDYFIKIDRTGKIIEYYVKDINYQYRYSGEGLNTEEIIEVEKIDNLDTSEVIEISCDGLVQD